jgi:Paraquat-inducible protein A
MFHQCWFSLISLAFTPFSVHSWYHSRQLAIGDFTNFNKLIQDITLYLPDTNLTEQILGVTLSLQLLDLQCFNLSFGDIQTHVVSAQQETNSLSNITSNNTLAQRIRIQIDPINATCVVNYNYIYGFLSGSGTATALTNKNSIESSFIISQTGQSKPPDTLSLDDCQPVINITNLMLEGGILASILDDADLFIRGYIQNQVELYICESLGGLNETTDRLLGTIASILTKYMVDVNETDPLLAEQRLNQSTLVNFQNPKGGISITVNVLLKEVSKILTKQSTNSNTGAMDLGINELLRQYVLDDNGIFHINASNVGLPDKGVLLHVRGNATSTLVAVEKIQSAGLDSFTRLEPLTSIGRYTLATNFSWEKILLNVDLRIEFSSENQNGDIVKVSEMVTLAFQVGVIEGTAAILLAIDYNLLGALQLGSLLELNNILPCLFSTLVAFDIPQLQISVESIEAPSIRGFDSPGLNRVAVALLEGLFEMYDDAIASALPEFFATTMKGLLASNIRDFIDNTPDHCSAPVVPTDLEFVDFRELLLPVSDAMTYGGKGSSNFGDLGVLTHSIVQTELITINPTTGLPKANTGLIDPLTLVQSNVTGTLSYPGNLLDINKELSVEDLAANIRLEVSDARIEFLNTIGNPLQLIAPVLQEPYLLDNLITFGTDTVPLRFAAHVLLEVIGDGDLNLYNEVTLSLDLTRANVELTAFLKMASALFLLFPIRDILNVNCWLSTLPAPVLDVHGLRVDNLAISAALERVEFNLERIALDIQCLKCSSPLLQNISESLADTVDDATRSAHNVLDYVKTLLEGEFLQTQVDRLVNEAPMKCPHNSEFVGASISRKYEPFNNYTESDSLSYFLTLAGTTIGVVLLFAIISYILKFFVRRRNTLWLRSLPSEKIFRIYRHQIHRKEKENQLNEFTSSMFSNSEIPKLVRWLMPLIILANAGFFLSGHLSIGGTVIVKVNFAGQELTIADFFEFSIARSILDLWNTGGKAIAILIILFSGVWPYTKLLFTLICWFLPPCRLSVTRRGSILCLLDELAKWSTIDIFVLVISLVAFRISVTSPTLKFLPSEFYSVNLLVVPLWGLYANLIAQLLSQVTSHCIIHYHCKIIRCGLERHHFPGRVDSSCVSEGNIEEIGQCPAPVVTSNSDRRDKLSDQSFARTHRGDSDGLYIRPGVNIALMIVEAFLVALTVVGCYLPCFTLERLGILGILIESGQDFQRAITEHSVFSIVNLLLEEAVFLGTAKDWIGMISISLVFLLTVLVVPLLQGLLLFYHWWIPTTRHRRSRVIVSVEICHAWQYLEVFVIAVMLSAWQLGPVSEFLINGYCDSLRSTFSTLVYFGIIASEDAQCFKVRASIEPGTFVLVAAAIILNLVNAFVMKAVAHYERDCAAREEELIDPSQLDEMTIDMIQEGDVKGVTAKIQLTGALFTDEFRWLLVSYEQANANVNSTLMDGGHPTGRYQGTE